MSNPFTIEFTLKQHTPIIHFQSGQAGATLRASEVKPKLDKFIMERVAGSVAEFEQRVKKRNTDNSDNTGFNPEWEQWLVGKGKAGAVALDYKCSVFPDETTVQNRSLGFDQHKGKYVTIRDRRDYGSLILANMGGKNSKEELKDLVMFGTQCVRIVCFDRRLKVQLEEQVSLFFALHNFGNRQSKGFGSFTVTAKKTGGAVSEVSLRMPPATPFLRIRSREPLDAFLVIDYYWKRLKSGINYGRTWNDGERYKKSALYKFLKSQTPVTHTWEKRWLKEKYYGLIENPDLPEPRFARALLGLPDKFEFVQLPQKQDRGKTGYHESEGDYGNHYRWKIDVSHPELKRIPAPVCFKPVETEAGWDIYILANPREVPPSAKSQAFEFAPEPHVVAYRDVSGHQQKFTIKFNKDWKPETAAQKEQEFRAEIRRLYNQGLIDDNKEAEAVEYLNFAFRYDLRLPSEALDLAALLRFYHQELTDHFTAISYGQHSVQVQVLSSP